MIRKTVAMFHCYAQWLRRLPEATELIFSARTPVGRAVKIFLFGIGFILPLGSLIWALLFWHGTYLRRYSHPETGIR